MDIVRRSFAEAEDQIRAKEREDNTPKVVAQCPVCGGDVVARQETIGFTLTPIGSKLPTRTVVACATCKVLFDGVPPVMTKLQIRRRRLANG